jgi:hypothetical protein
MRTRTRTEASVIQDEYHKRRAYVVGRIVAIIVEIVFLETGETANYSCPAGVFLLLLLLFIHDIHHCSIDQNENCNVECVAGPNYATTPSPP